MRYFPDMYYILIFFIKRKIYSLINKIVKFTFVNSLFRNTQSYFKKFHKYFIAKSTNKISGTIVPQKMLIIN